MTDQAQAFARAICAAVKIPLPPGLVGVAIKTRIMFMEGNYKRPYEAARLVLTGLSPQELEEMSLGIIKRDVMPYRRELVRHLGREKRVEIIARYTEDHLLALHDVYDTCGERGGLSHQLEPHPA